MRKSNERIQLELKIQQKHDEAHNIAMHMVNEEFNGNLNAALSDASFVKKMQTAVKDIWQFYRLCYRTLEDLEKREGYRATHICANVLDKIAKHLPADKNICYYPFSGVDFYWARIFNKVVCEDISFGKKELPNMWWDPETYGLERRKEIIATLKAQKIIPKSASLEFVVGDAETARASNQFNNSNTTLLIKGGHDFLGYVKSRFFAKKPLRYGAIITVTATNPLKDIEERLARDDYSRKASLEGTNWLIPYAMQLKDIHVFIKKF
jgi:hypothetical protein